VTWLLWAIVSALAWYFYARCVSLQRQITEIVRQDALRRAEGPEEGLCVRLPGHGSRRARQSPGPSDSRRADAA